MFNNPRFALFESFLGYRWRAVIATLVIAKNRFEQAFDHTCVAKHLRDL
jgi:hypothetical protein